MYTCRGGSRGGSQGAADPPLEAGANVFRFGAHTRIYGGAGRPATRPRARRHVHVCIYVHVYCQCYTCSMQLEYNEAVAVFWWASSQTAVAVCQSATVFWAISWQQVSLLYTIPVARPNANETPPCVYLCTHVCRITQCHGSGSANTSEAGSSSSLNQEPTRSQSPSSSSRYVLRNVWLLQGS